MRLNLAITLRLSKLLKPTLSAIIVQLVPMEYFVGFLEESTALTDCNVRFKDHDPLHDSWILS